MEQLSNDLSSIILDYIPGGEDLSNMSIVSNELSSVSDITVSEVVDTKAYSETYTTEIKTLRDKLIENVTILQNELELFESTTRKEAKKENSKPVEISDQLSEIQIQVNIMREKLKESEGVIEKKSRENLELREMLQNLEKRNSGSGHQCLCYKNCQVI